jgi:hypothetical protein
MVSQQSVSICSCQGAYDAMQTRIDREKTRESERHSLLVVAPGAEFASALHRADLNDIHRCTPNGRTAWIERLNTVCTMFSGRSPHPPCSVVSLVVFRSALTCPGEKTPTRLKCQGLPGYHASVTCRRCKPATISCGDTKASITGSAAPAVVRDWADGVQASAATCSVFFEGKSQKPDGKPSHDSTR